MSGREQQYIAEVFDSNYIAPVGPHLNRFEEMFAAKVGVSHAAAVASAVRKVFMVSLLVSGCPLPVRRAGDG